MSRKVRLTKMSTREGRSPSLTDGRVIEGEEVSPATLGLPYAVKPTVTLIEGSEEEVFITTAVRAILVEGDGPQLLLTDNSTYGLEEI